MDAGTLVRTPPEELWKRLAPLSLFADFTEQQRQSFQDAYRREDGMRVQHFDPRGRVCDKGQYELDLCFILRGSVDLYDHQPTTGYTRVASLAEGSFYGELGAIGGIPRSTDVVAGSDGVELFYLPRYCLKYLFINSQARERLNQLYQERALRVIARENEIFQGVPNDFITRLIPQCRIDFYDLRGVVLVNQGEPGDALYYVRDGYVMVRQRRADGSSRILGYLNAGEYFAEAAILPDVDRREVVESVQKEVGGEMTDSVRDVLEGRRNATVLSAGKCEIVRIPAEAFRELCEHNPAVRRRVKETVRHRLLTSRKITPELSADLEKSGQLGIVQADALLVMDLDLCIKCDNCVTACESLHGESRLIRTGVPIGKYLIPAACRHCDDPKCMNACPTGAIKRRPEGEIYFQYDMCIGCGNCAIACPYDNIAMIETAKFDAAQKRKSQVLGRNFYRPYPVASHGAEATLWERIFGRHSQGERERLSSSLFQRILGRSNPSAPPVTPAAAPGAALQSDGPPTHPHIPPAFPIKCDLCDGLPFMGCVHACPTGAAMRITGRDLFAQSGAVSFGQARVVKAFGGHD